MPTHSNPADAPSRLDVTGLENFLVGDISWEVSSTALCVGFALRQCGPAPVRLKSSASDSLCLCIFSYIIFESDIFEIDWQAIYDTVNKSTLPKQPPKKGM